MIKRFKQDAGRWVIPSKIVDPASINLFTLLKLFWRHVPLQAMLFFRLGSWFHSHHIPLLPGIIEHMVCAFYGLEIAASADIGGGLYLPHPVGTVIAPRHIGENCSIIASVTIGMRNEWEFPWIGDHVFIGAGARVLGGVKVGDGAVIGANAVVITDIPPAATAVGIPARVINTRPQPARAGAALDRVAI